VAEVVCNASPIILLARIDRLDILEAHATRILIPRRVLDEIRAGEPHDPSVRRVEHIKGAAILPDAPVPDVLARWALDAGETQVLVHAMAGTAPLSVLDDRAARRVARTLDLKVIGTIGLVAWAKSTGLIPLAAPVLDELCRAGMRVSTPLIDEVLELVGEPR
jgi:predicted nucleic acid-binding protein